MITYTLKVIEIKKETEDTITLCFKQPGLRKVKYFAGQYLTLIFRINGRRYIRPYSFSSAPMVDSQLELTVKRVPGGIVSNHIHDIVAVGDSIEVMPAMGDFICENTTAEYIFLWGVGSGITPLISITKQLLATSACVQVNLIYGNRNAEQTIFLNLIQSLVDQFPDRFKVWHFHTQLSVSSTPPYLVQGRINGQSVVDVMQGIEADKSLHYICGPLGLKESLKISLTELDVRPAQIFAEDFELVKDPKDFERINTQNVKLKFANQEYDLEVIKGKSILESALDAGIELPYSCQTGNCSTCKAKIISGQAKMIGLSKVREDLLDDECLVCCSHPLTENVLIEIN